MKSFFVVLTFLVLNCFQSFSQVNLSNGLVGYFPFSGNANDASGNNHHGVLQNSIQLTSDRFGNLNSAFLFDGVDDYIAVNDNMGNFSTPHFSLVLWFKTSSNSLQNLIGKRNFGPTNGQQCQFFINYPPFPGIGSNIISNQNVCSVGITSSTSYINSNTDICLGRWYSAIITFDGSFHNIYINGVLVRSVATSFNTMAQCNSELRFGNWWQDDLIPFNGVMDDIRWYNRPLNEDEIQVLSANSGGSLNADFTYNYQLCQPNQISFNAITQNSTISGWEFGDQTQSNGINQPVHIYQQPGKYNVRLITQSGQNCRDTVVKPIEIYEASANIFLTQDTTICSGDSIRIRANITNEFCGDNFPMVAQAEFKEFYIKPVTNTTYLVRTSLNTPNLVANGDFENGNSGFNSNYIFTNTRNSDGQYGINTNASAWYSGLSCTDCNDHGKTLPGNMLVADASGQSNYKVWSQTIQVVQDNTYSIEFWVNTYDPQVAARIELLINDRNGGTWTFSQQEIGKWKKLSTFWNAGKDSILNMQIVNSNLSLNLNRFAIDDIQVRLHNIINDSLKVNVNQGLNIVASTDNSICAGQTMQLAVTGGTNYFWSPSTSLSDPAIANPIASPLATTRYIVRATSGSSSCGGIDSVIVTVNPVPDISISKNTSTCEGIPVQVKASGGVKYQWSPSQSLSDASLPNPMASPAVNTTYTVVVTDINGCSDDGEVKVSIAPMGKIYIPNAFTPNSDGINDCFTIQGALGSPFFELSIYNRFGEKVFFANNPSSCWDGNFRGLPQPTGSFAYTLKMSGPCGVFTEKGTVTVIR